MPSPGSASEPPGLAGFKPGDADLAAVGVVSGVAALRHPNTMTAPSKTNTRATSAFIRLLEAIVYFSDTGLKVLADT